MTKACSVCEVVKPITDFYVNKKGVPSKGCNVCVRNPGGRSRYSVNAPTNFRAHNDKINAIKAEKRAALKDLFHGR